MLISPTARVNQMDQLDANIPRSRFPKACLQPGCLLRRKDLDMGCLAEILVFELAGKPLDELIDKSERIVVRTQCTACVLCVLKGGKAYLTDTEHEELIKLGHWHHRRQRRRDRLR